MPIILVVDDSETDRKLVGGLLKPKLDWIVQYASNGTQALEMIGSVFPDIVVTDLKMPEMDGIQLCTRSKVEFPHVPIVLITGMGSEELAVEALEAGAASYVPKSALAGSLLETVEQLLALSKSTQSKERLMNFSTSTRHQFNLPNEQELISPLLEFVKSEMEILGVGDQTERRHVSVAIEEALINAIFHGNLEMNGSVVQDARRALHDGVVAEFVKERSLEPPFSDRRIRIAIEISRKQIEVVVRDDGDGFDAVGKTEKSGELSQLSGAGGRGLTLIHNFMDDVSFNEAGNEVHMKLKMVARKSAPQEAANA
jgi:CheY-like chemotaxis protein/anti-sigma regulatory factor (Ser/Thr protein kinase)